MAGTGSAGREISAAGEFRAALGLEFTRISGGLHGLRLPYPCPTLSSALAFLAGDETRMSNPPDIPSSQCSPGRGSTGETREQVAVFLSLCLGVFIADGILSVILYFLVGFLGVRIPGLLDGALSLFALAVLGLAFAVYCLMGITPLVPKRYFLPIVLIYPATWLLLVPASIFFPEHMNGVLLAVSFCQAALGMAVAFCLRDGKASRWQLVPAGRLGQRNFSWGNSSVFAFANLVLLAATILYLAIFSALAVDHFSGGFVSLRPDGLNVRIKKFIRDDKKTVWLVPMSHIGGARYYEALSKALPHGSVVLMEGVSDRKKLLTNPISYARAATVLGLAEQRKKFQIPGKIVPADLDVDQFASGTIDILNVLMLPHAKGLTFETLLKLAQFKPTEAAMNQCWDDLLAKRNRKLVAEIASRLPNTETIIVPWGAAHMPGISAEIQKMGFRCGAEQEITAIPFAAGR